MMLPMDRIIKPDSDELKINSSKFDIFVVLLFLNHYKEVNYKI